MLFSRFYRLKLYRRGGMTTAPFWPDTASLRHCQGLCSLLRPILEPPKAVLPAAGWQGYGVSSRFCCHPFFWSRDCCRSGIDFGFPPRLSLCWPGLMRQSFHVHEFAVSPDCWCRIHVVGRLVAKEKAIDCCIYSTSLARGSGSKATLVDLELFDANPVEIAETQSHRRSFWTETRRLTD